MASDESRFSRRRLRSSYLTSVVSLSMVLLMMGLLSLLLINAGKLSDTTRENFTVSVFFRDTVAEITILRFKENLESRPYVSEVKLISREQAAENFQKELGEDFVEFLGYNPLPASVDVRFKQGFSEPANIQMLEQEWMANPLVEKVDYPRQLIDKIASNMRKLSWFLLGFSVLLGLIAVTLINNTIRLAIYSRRFLIKTMQLVGATTSFIRGPFLWSGLLQGFWGGMLALIFLAGAIFVAEQQIPELKTLRDFRLWGILAAGLLVSGMLLSWICTFFAVRKYLKIKTDSLY